MSGVFSYFFLLSVREQKKPGRVKNSNIRRDNGQTAKNNKNMADI
jgi:hypothetical protein